MTKASSIFDVFPWANWISKDKKEDCICLWRVKPTRNSDCWAGITPMINVRSAIDVDEFQCKNWTDCIIERPKEVKTFEELRAWAKEHADVEDSYDGRFDFSYGLELFFIIEDNGEETGINNGYGDLIFCAKPAQVKRVLEAMLND